MSSDESLTPLEVLNTRLAEVREAMVLAKWGNLWWPSRIATDEEFEIHKKTNDTKSKYLVFFFGSHDYGWVNLVKKYEKDSVEEKSKSQTSAMRLGYLEANLLLKELPCTNCLICGGADHEEEIILCDICDSEYHMKCLIPQLKKVPDSEWICPRCTVLGQRNRKNMKKNTKGGKKVNNNNNNNKRNKRRRRKTKDGMDDNEDDNDEIDGGNERDGIGGSEGGGDAGGDNDILNEDENYTPTEKRKRKSTSASQVKEEPSAKKTKTTQNDEYCNICHNNGFLLFCDHKNCTKSYHPQCVGLIHPPEETEWICPVHYCKMCLKMSEEDDIYYHCTNCPSSWCSVECMDKDVSSITIHSTKKCTYCSTPSPLIQFTLILENCLMKVIQSKVGNIFYLPFPDDKVCCLRTVLKEIRSLSFTNYLTFLEYLRQTLNKMCSSEDNDKESFPYLRKAANITFETIKTIIEKELKYNNLLDLKIPDDVDKSVDINFRKELTLFPDEEEKVITTKIQRERYCSNLKVVPVEHKLPEFNQPVASKIQVHQKQDGNGAKVQITQVPPPGIPTDVLKSVSLTDEEDKRLCKILSKIPQGESNSYRDYVTLDLPSIASLMDQQEILFRKLVEQNAVLKRSISLLYKESNKDNKDKVNNKKNRISSPPRRQEQSQSQLQRQLQQKRQQQQRQEEQEPPPPSHPPPPHSHSHSKSIKQKIEKEVTQKEEKEVIEKEKEKQPTEEKTKIIKQEPSQSLLLNNAMEEEEEEENGEKVKETEKNQQQQEKQELSLPEEQSLEMDDSEDSLSISPAI